MWCRRGGPVSEDGLKIVKSLRLPILGGHGYRGVRERQK